MKNYFIFFICVASLVASFYFLVMYFTYETRPLGFGFSLSQPKVKAYYQEDLLYSATGFITFIFTAFYLWKNNFFKRNN